MIHQKVNTKSNIWNIKHLYNTLVLENAKKKKDIVKPVDFIAPANRDDDLDIVQLQAPLFWQWEKG